jgi:hypothetical protein
MSTGKKIVPSSTNAVSQILTLVKEALKKKNYWDTPEIKQATELAKLCPDVNRICIYKPFWGKGDYLTVGLFHTETIVHSYAQNGAIVENIDTKSIK